ncbi:D-isomer specific 2-hydroxyacid dehydrogenase [Schizophyllum amplum]|uniref:D-isomer specific 2-hydroxyacid dehydrogenase n=1 Tax=Schizophyllum amplum TaxID=97359 RepID=A0A550C6F2_9AGAR|nr:D-isomer specific 2-hydroxyacid dehydrogenase [Auriculariopsis ampla]
MTAPTLQTLGATCPLSDKSLAQLRALFPTVHYYPKEDIPLELLAQCDVLYANPGGLPPHVTDIAQVPRLVHLQLRCAGADKVLQHPALRPLLDQGKEPPFTLATSSGLHTIAIPQYIIGTALALYHRLQQQILFTKNEKRWPSHADVVGDTGDWFPPSVNEYNYYGRSLRGRTVGMLGYGHIAREAARLFQTFGCTILAANTAGKPRVDEGFFYPGTGDKDGHIPQAYYSTADEEGMKDFYRKTDILVASLPGTEKTKGYLTEDKLALLKPYAAFINVGRGSLVSSEALLARLNAKEGMCGVALDVTNPEPLPAGHPLYSHPRAIITPHVSGVGEGEFEIAVDVFEFNVQRLRDGEGIGHPVGWLRGY